MTTTRGEADGYRNRVLPADVPCDGSGRDRFPQMRTWPGRKNKSGSASIFKKIRV